MSNVGYDTWFKKTCPTVFVVKNIAADGKRIRLFKYPIKNGETRDLLEIPYVSEADIRHSLLKGELFIKIMAREIFITESNIDLIQFDPCHRSFLEAAGITIGLDAGDGYSGGGGLAEMPYLWRTESELLGPKNNSNRVFMVPNGDKFLDGNFDGNDFHIEIDHNGRRILQNIDFIISESGGIGTGYDTVRFISFVPNTKSKIFANYVISNT